MTAPAPPDHWQGHGERGAAFMMKLLSRCALWLGRPLTRVVLWFVVGYFLLANAQARRASREYLSRVLDHSASWRDIARHFYWFATTSVDRVYFLANRMQAFDVEVNEPEVILSRLQSAPPRGVLLFMAHFGSFEVLRALGKHERQLPITLLMDRELGRRFTALIESIDGSLRANIVDASQPGPALVLALNEALNAGHIVGIMADRARLGDATCMAQFLGAAAPWPTSPWLLAHALKAPVILGVGVFEGGNRYRGHFEVLAERVEIPRRERERAVQQYAQLFADRLAHYARRSPYNWFNFYRFWNG